MLPQRLLPASWWCAILVWFTELIHSPPHLPWHEAAHILVR